MKEEHILQGVREQKPSVKEIKDLVIICQEIVSRKSLKIAYK